MATGNTKFTTQHGLQVVGNTEIEDSLKVLGSANIVGDLTVGGSMVFSANIVGNFMPDVSGRALGNNTNRWDTWANSLNVSNTATFNGDTVPTANGVLLGDSDSRWYLYSTNISVSNSISVGNTITVNNNLNIGNSAFVGNAASFQSSTLDYKAVVPSQQFIDTFNASEYSTAKYLIQAKSANNSHTLGYMACEILLTQNGQTVFLNEYGTVFSNTIFCTFDADIAGGSVRLLANTTTNTVFKVVRTSISR